LGVGAHIETAVLLKLKTMGGKNRLCMGWPKLKFVWQGDAAYYFLRCMFMPVVLTRSKRARADWESVRKRANWKWYVFRWE